MEKMYFTIDPNYGKLLRNSKSETHKAIDNAVHYDNFPNVTFHTHYNARRMADRGPGWVMIRKEGDSYFRGINGSDELDYRHTNALDRILELKAELNK
jgi:hypothetical protein